MWLTQNQNRYATTYISTSRIIMHFQDMSDIIQRPVGKIVVVVDHHDPDFVCLFFILSVAAKLLRC